MKGYLIIELVNPGTNYENYKITGSLSDHASLTDSLFSVYDGRSRLEDISNWVVGGSSCYNSIDQMRIVAKLLNLAFDFIHDINSGHVVNPKIIEVSV